MALPAQNLVMAKVRVATGNHLYRALAGDTTAVRDFPGKPQPKVGCAIRRKSVAVSRQQTSSEVVRRDGPHHVRDLPLHRIPARHLNQRLPGPDADTVVDEEINHPQGAEGVADLRGEAFGGWVGEGADGRVEPVGRVAVGQVVGANVRTCTSGSANRVTIWSGRSVGTANPSARTRAQSVMRGRLNAFPPHPLPRQGERPVDVMSTGRCAARTPQPGRASRPRPGPSTTAGVVLGVRRRACSPKRARPPAAPPPIR